MSLRVWLPLDGDLRNQGISNITPNNMGGITANAAGKIGSCMSFNGSGTGYLRMPAILTATDNFSICFWMKLNNNTANHCLYSQRVNATANGFSIFYLTGSGIRFDDGAALTTGTILNANQWYHIVCCRDNSKKYIYIDGLLNTSGAKNNTNTSNVNINYSLIGGSQNTTAGDVPNANYFNGYLNDYRIYDHCLSAAEVKEISQGLVLHYKLDNNGLGNRNLFWGTLSPSTTIENVINILGTKFASGQGSTYTSHTRTNRPHGIQSTVSSAARPYIALGHPTAATCLAAPDPMWGLSAGNTYTFSGDLEYKVYSANLELGSYFVIRLYYIKSGETAWTNAGNLRQFTTHPGEVHNYHFELPFTLPIDAIGWYIFIGSNNSGASHNAAGDYVAIDNIKLEEGNVATPYSPAPEDFGAASIVEDSSGYGHNGIIIGNPTIAIPSQRYSAYTSFNGTTDSIKADISFEIEKAQNFTFSAWIYSDRWNTSVNDYFLSSQESGGFLIRTLDSNKIRVRVNAFTAADFSTNSYIDADATLSSVGITSSGWHMITGVYTTSDLKLYVDGELQSTKTITTYGLHFNSNTNLFLGAECAGANPNPFCKCGLSDVRIYYTSLLDTDVKQLYNVSMKIDKSSKIHTFEVFENGQNKITKQGQLKCANIIEFNGLSYLKYDSNLYIEPDGSCWVRIFHHNNPAAALFASTDDFAHSVYKDEDRWFNVELCNYLNSWELLIRSKRTEDDTEVAYRWVQSANPMTATADEVTADLVTYNTNGYNTRSWGGIYKRATADYTYLNTHNGTAGNWYGAIGGYSLWNGGTTGQRTTGAANAITTGYVDLYVRVDNLSTTFPSNAKSTKNNLWLTSNIIER